jgi:Pentapeptide repeats (8 copies)
MRLRSTFNITGRVALGVTVCVAAIFLVVFAVWIGPVVLTRYSGAGITPIRHLQLMNDVRTTLLGALAGAGALGGLVYTGRTYSLSREGQITDRYTRTVDQLGSTNIDVRTAAIYALERIMLDSRFDRLAIIDLLASFVRGHARGDDISRPADRDPAIDTDAAFEELYRQLFSIPYLIVRAYDVQAAVTILGRTPKPAGSEPIRLGDTDLIRSYLYGVRFAGISLSEAHLEIAQLSRADLRDASLFRTRLVGAYLNETDLRRADLSGADLRRAELNRADLRQAILCGADLRLTVLDSANLQGAMADEFTQWPAGFDAVGAGVIVFPASG